MVGFFFMVLISVGGFYEKSISFLTPLDSFIEVGELILFLPISTFTVVVPQAHIELVVALTDTGEAKLVVEMYADTFKPKSLKFRILFLGKSKRKA